MTSDAGVAFDDFVDTAAGLLISNTTNNYIEYTATITLPNAPVDLSAADFEDVSVNISGVSL